MSETTQFNNFFPLEKPSQETLKKINYVAIGGIYASGFNSKIGFATNGFLDNNNNIYGLSYPSFFATLIKDSNFLELSSFYNLSMPGSSIDLWNALVTKNKDKIKASQKRLDFLQSLDWHISNPFKNYFSSLFDKWNVLQGDFNIVSNKINDANLITITLGLGDVFFKIPFEKINRMRLAKAEEALKIYQQINNEIIDACYAVENKLIKLYKAIREKNPTAKIVFVSYTKPFIYLETFIQEALKLEKLIKTNFLEDTIKKVNEAMKKCANKCQTSYVDVYDEFYWEKNKAFLFENIFAPFPTENGYKKIAYDLFTKLCLNKETFLQEILIPHKFDNYIINKEYWLRDLRSYEQIFSPKFGAYELFKSIFGSNLNYNILVYSENEAKIHSILAPYLRFAKTLDAYIRYNDGDQTINMFVNNLLDDFFNEAPEKYASIEMLKNYLLNSGNGKKIYLALLKNGKLEKILFILQRSLIQKNLLAVDKKTIQNEWHNILISNQKLIYDVFKQLFNANIISSSKEEIKEIILTLISDLFNGSMYEFLNTKHLNFRYTIIRDYFLSIKTINDFVIFVVESIVNYASLYEKLSSFDELWKNWIVNNKYKFFYFIDKTFLEISSQENIDSTVELICQIIFQIYHIDALSLKERQILEKSIKNIILVLKENQGILNAILAKFIDRIKNYSFYDLLVKKDKNQNIFKKSKWVRNIVFLRLITKTWKDLISIKKIVNRNKMK
ncbi:Uncharacterised protein [Metamycoplasma arthritidis]|uniref:Putative esterase or lipase, membrane protein n=1 Tax=Metamycoplasma arthritidis (strain 158L3-1) TaxID=243272 RepID=B3PMI5_META1|nr:GDSL-type esterase/lipase family protein [Metamycoplasma arthritidis]ACF07237.1 putative esterase or lipase, membrane protein [Metamycoplasma arthritidis 158L3-1]VEU78761.1 Uncharacterised protein [Metamycoplasma arthritidis]